MIIEQANQAHTTKYFRTSKHVVVTMLQATCLKKPPTSQTLETPITLINAHFNYISRKFIFQVGTLRSVVVPAHDSVGTIL